MKSILSYIPRRFLVSNFICLGLGLLILSAGAVHADAIFSNVITDSNPSANNPYTSGQVVVSNLTVSGIGRGTGIVGTSASGRYNANSWDTTELDPDGYFTWTLTPADGFKIDFTSLVYVSQASGTGAKSFAIRSSADGFTANIATPTTTGGTIDLSGVSFQNVTTAIEFRLYGWAATGSSGSFSVNDFIFNGSVSSSTPVVLNYWDANGATAGAGGATPTGTWGTDSFWTNSETGETATTTWTPGGDAVFAAGTDATGIYIVTLSGTQSTGSVKFEEGSILLSGGVLELSDNTPVLNVITTQAEIASDISGVNGINKVGTGTLILTGSKTFAGLVDLTGGVLQIAASEALGVADNDLTLNGTLSTTASFSLPATRSITGSGNFAPADTTTLEILGDVTMGSLGVADVGTVDLKGSVRSVGSLAFSAAGKVTGDALTATGLSASFVGGTASVSNSLDLGTTSRTASVSDATSTLELLGDITLGGSASLTKSGAGTLKLFGANSTLNRVSIGSQSASPATGGKIVINNKDSLGAQQTFFNYGEIESTVDLTDADSIATGLSIGGRDGAPVALLGSDMTFQGNIGFFLASGTTGDIRLNVSNHTTLTGAFVTVAANGGTLTGFAVGGNGILTLAGDMSGYQPPLKLTDTATVELDPSTAISATANISQPISLLAGTKLAIGTVGTAKAVTAFAGLAGAADSVLHFDIGGTTRGTDYDALILSKPDGAAAAVTFAGKIDVDVIGGFTLAIGQSFDLLDWDASVTPDFTGIDFSLLPVLDPSMAWSTSTFSTNGTISIVSTAITIVDQPDSVSVDPGTQVTFTVVASAPGEITYQWYKGIELIPDAISASYTINSVQESDQGNYSVVVSSDGNSVPSEIAVLDVIDPFVPVSITGHPQSKIVDPGVPVSFTVTAAGSGVLTYQWRKGVTDIPDSNSATYTINAAQESDEGSYSVVVTGTGVDNFAISDPATLLVNPLGAISITGNGNYLQDFNGMGTSGTTPPNGWFAYDSDANPGTSVLAISDGGSNSGKNYNYGTAADADRALGSVSSGSFVGAFGATFANNSGSTIEGANISFGFRAEQWRQGTTTAQEVWTFEWKLGGNFDDSTGWTGASTFNITEILDAAVASGAIQGNAEGNYVTLALTNFADLTGWENGEVLHIRWRDSDDTGSDSGMAIDDFQLEVSGVVPPAPFFYWDANGNLAGSGGPTPQGTWGVDNFWSDSPTGEAVTGAWISGNEAVFAAGDDATGTYTIPVTGTQDISGVVLEEGLLTLNGGTLNFIDATPVIKVQSGTLTLESVLTGSTGLSKQGSGTLVLSGANLFTGNIALGAGILEIAADSALGDTANDLSLTGLLKTTATFDLPATRDITSSGNFAPASGTELGVLGNVSVNGLGLADIGTLDLRGASNSVGIITVSAAGTLQGGDLVASKITASLESGTATIENAIDFGTIVRTIEVPNADATLALTGNVTLNGINNDRLIKTGSGTLVLNGTNTNLIRMAIGIQSATTPVDGGIVLFGNKNALGNSKTFLNYGVLKASTELIGANALPIGISFSGRDGSPSVLEGESFEFTGADSELYSLAAGSGDIRANVNNHTIISGPVFASTSATITGLAVGGSGKLTLSGALSSFTTALKLKDSVTVELNPGSFDSLSSTNAVVYETLSLATGTTLAVTTIGTTGVAKAYSSVNAESGSVIQFDIGGTARGDAVSGYDVLSFAATAAPVAPPTYTFAGAIKVQFVSGFVPAAGQTFDILDWDASATPDFAAVSFDLPDVSGANLIWDTSDFTTDGTLKILLNVVTVEVTPVTQNLNVGDTAVFTATATGPGTITYQWQYGTTDIPDETGTTLTIENVAVVNSGNYRCVVSNGVDTVASEPVTLTVTPAVTGFVASRTPSTDLLYVGDKVTFKVTGGGSGLTYQWLKGSSPIEGATSSTYVIDATATTDTADYSVLVSNGGPQVPSNVVPLTVLAASPVIVSDPTPQQLLKVGDAFSLQVVATGRPPIRYQWSRDGKPISGATRSSFSSPSASLAQGGTYTCEVSNQAGESDSSDSALVGVVLTNTLNINLAAGKNGSFKVQANGPNLSFNWLRDGAAQPPANFSLSQDGKTLTGTALLVEDYGTYACTVTMGLLTQVGGTHNLKVFDQAPESPETVEMPDGIIGGSYTYAMPYTVSEPPREAPSTFAAKGLPSGLKMDTKTGIISGRPTKSGDFSVTMTAKNTLGSTTTIGSLLIKAYPDSLSGVYVGLVERSTEINGSLGGRVDLTVTTTGAYSGTLTLGATKYKLKGSIEVNAETPDAEEVPTVLSLIVPRKGDPVPLQVDIVLTLNESEDRYLTGSVSDGVNTAAMEGYRYKWNVKTGPSATAYAQYYTFRTELAESELIGDSTVPQGSGYGTFTLKPDGKVKIAGATGDGQKLTLASYLGPVGEILVYQTVYTPVKGSIGGALEITAAALPEDNTLTGELSVIRPANAKSRAYKEGFGPLELDAFGAAYTPDTTKVALDLTAGSSANLMFSEAGLTSELVETSLADITVTINAKDKTVITSPSPSPTLTKFSSLKSKTGLFAGTFTLSDENPISTKPPILKRKSKFQGVIVKELTGYYGYGYFLLDQLPTEEPPTTTKTSPNLSGHVEFAPVEE